MYETKMLMENLVRLHKSGLVPKALIDKWEDNTERGPIEEAENCVKKKTTGSITSNLCFFVLIVMGISLASLNFLDFEPESFMGELQLGMWLVVFLPFSVLCFWGIFQEATAYISVSQETKSFAIWINNLLVFVEEGACSISSDSTEGDLRMQTQDFILIPQAIKLEEAERDYNEASLDPQASPEKKSKLFQKREELRKEYRIKHQTIFELGLVESDWGRIFNLARAQLKHS